uniref:RRM domain-containing protein n=1 Tax=Romanomermis culicivorax TaxID=13658 RepID=A0A915L8Q1_ROMCU
MNMPKTYILSLVLSLEYCLKNERVISKNLRLLEFLISSFGGVVMDDRRPIVQNERRNWKLLYDPIIKKGIQKLYRFDGIVPGNANANLSVRHLSDPRLISARSRGKVDAADLHIPSFKVDENYVGKPPSTEVSFFDVNDNVSQSFLEDLCKKCGDIEEVRIFYHAKTKVHLGIGRVVFRKIKAAAYCVEKYNNAPIMGKPVRAMLDPLGKQQTVLMGRDMRRVLFPP